MGTSQSESDVLRRGGHGVRQASGSRQGGDASISTSGRAAGTTTSRLLAYIELPDGRFLNEELLSEGFAYADLRFRHSYYQKYQQLEAAPAPSRKVYGRTSRPSRCRRGARRGSTTGLADRNAVDVRSMHIVTS